MNLKQTKKINKRNLGKVFSRMCWITDELIIYKFGQSTVPIKFSADKTLVEIIRYEIENDLWWRVRL